jgi:hypothetical protein
MEVDALPGRNSSAVPRTQISPVPPYRSQAWYLAYMDALFETDRSHIGDRIKRAEQLIVFRERELLSEKTALPEHRALSNALHALRALRSCFGV